MKNGMIAALAVLALIPAMLRAQIGNIVVTNAASFQPGVPAPGSIGTIFCTGLVINGVVSAPGVPLPFSLAGVTVTIGGAAAPLFAVADLGGYQQINLQVPQETQLGVAGTVPAAEVTITQNGVQGTITVNLASDPGEFFRIGTTQYGVLQHAADNSLVTASNPAKGGEMIIGYATGLQPPGSSVAIGQPAPTSPLYYVPQVDNNPTNVNLTGLFIKDSAGSSFNVFNLNGLYNPNGDLPFMGLTPGAVGLYQINFVLPGLAAGNAAIDIRHMGCNEALAFLSGCGAPGATVFTDGQTVLIPAQ
jgi:uncharacterized protein (TIGR03437 family)